MKKYVLLAIISMLMFPWSTNAQKGKEIIIGGGAAFTSVWILNQNFYGEPELNYAPKVGYAVSFNLGYHFTENLGFQTEIQYSMQGQKYDDKQIIDEVKYDAKRDITLRYINVPLLIKYAFGTSSTKFRFMAGPQISYLLEATQEYTRDGKKLGTTAINLNGKEFRTDAGNISNRFQEYDVSIVGDLGADIHLNDKLFFSPGIRINYGLTDINEEAYHLPDKDGEYTPSHNFWFGCYIGLFYKIDVEGYSQRSF